MLKKHCLLQALAVATIFVATGANAMTTNLLRSKKAAYNKKSATPEEKTRILTELVNATPATDHKADREAAKLARNFATAELRKRGVTPTERPARVEPTAPTEPTRTGPTVVTEPERKRGGPAGGVHIPSTPVAAEMKERAEARGDAEEARKEDATIKRLTDIEPPLIPAAAKRTLRGTQPGKLNGTLGEEGYYAYEYYRLPAPYYTQYREAFNNVLDELSKPADQFNADNGRKAIANLQAVQARAGGAHTDMEGVLNYWLQSREAEAAGAPAPEAPPMEAPAEEPAAGGGIPEAPPMEGPAPAGELPEMPASMAAGTTVGRLEAPDVEAELAWLDAKQDRQGLSDQELERKKSLQKRQAALAREAAAAPAEEPAAGEEAPVAPIQSEEFKKTMQERAKKMQQEEEEEAGPEWEV